MPHPFLESWESLRDPPLAWVMAEGKKRSYIKGALWPVVVLTAFYLFRVTYLKSPPKFVYAAWRSTTTNPVPDFKSPRKHYAAGKGTPETVGQESNAPLKSTILAHPTPGRYASSEIYFQSLKNSRLQSLTQVDVFGWPQGLPTNHSVQAPSSYFYLATLPNSKTYRHVVNLHYSPEAMRPGRDCRRFEGRPAILTAVRYPHNQWHGYAEGLMSIFHTFRQSGVLPLIEVNEKFEWYEVNAGISQTAACPHVLIGHEAACSDATPALRHGICDPQSDDERSWCKPGMWIAPWVDKPQIILLYENGIHARFKPYYSLFSDTVLAEDMRGVCFSHLIMSKTRTLNFFLRMHEEKDIPSYHVQQRMEGIEVLNKLIRSAVQSNDGLYMDDYKGYSNSDWEFIRREGISATNQSSLIDSLYISPKVSRGLSSSDWDTMRDHQLLRSRQSLPTRAQQVVMKSIPSTHYTSPSDATAEFIGLKKGRSIGHRVVTLMTRLDGGSRALLNEGDLARYVLARYNVTVHITTFAEPLPLAMDLLSKTDVLIGVHGAGWTNAVFLKPGAAAVQLFPYGFRIPDSSPFKFTRGANLMNIVLARAAHYLVWENENIEFSFFTPKYISKIDPVLHPSQADRESKDNKPMLYQNTWADLESLAPVLDKALYLVGAQLL